MDKRLALRMVFLLVAALLGGILLVFHVRDMENQRLRRDLQGLAESLAIMLGPEQIQHLQNQQGQPAGPAYADLARIRDQFRTVKSIHHGNCRVAILERRGTQVHCLVSSQGDGQDVLAAGGNERDRPDEVLSLFEINTSLVQGPRRGRDGSTTYVAFAPIRNATKAATMVCVEMDASEGIDGVTGERDRGEEADDQVKLVFTVSDTGVGIPPDRLNVIFEPLEQAGGDEGLLRDLIELFLDRAPGQLELVQHGLERGDGQSAARAAHTLKGSASHFLVPEALAPLHELERLSKAGRMDKARERFASVKALADDLFAVMSQIIRRPAEPVLSSPRRLDDEFFTL